MLVQILVDYHGQYKPYPVIIASTNPSQLSLLVQTLTSYHSA